MKVLINNGPPTANNYVDYTKYVVQGTLSVQDSINVPILTNFVLEPSDARFVVPRRSSYVRIVSEIFASASGYGSGKVLATGFVTSEPDRQYLGVDARDHKTGFQHFQYNIKVSSDEWLLNTKTVPYIPAFVNQTDSQILAAIANVLHPGFFDTTSFMASGTLVPYFQYDSAQTWSDVAKTFADANRFHYKVIDRKIIYQPFGDVPLGISYDEATQRGGNISPYELSTNVLSVPPVNDCTVVGDTEPQANWDNYFIGDGFSANFLLKHIVFEGSSSLLLSDDWTEASFNRSAWIVNDPIGVFALTDTGGNAVGALNINQKGFPGVYVPQNVATYIQAQNGVELGGGLNLQHGQFTFNEFSEGIIGGLFGTSTFTPGNCLAGFGITGQQPTIDPVTITSVQHDANSQLVRLTYTGFTGPLQPGYVVTGSGFSSATFLNGVKYSVQSIVGGVITLIGITIFPTVYGPTADSGTLNGAENDVLVTASGTAGVVMIPILNGRFLDQVSTGVAVPFGDVVQFGPPFQGNGDWQILGADSARCQSNGDASIFPINQNLVHSQNPRITASVTVTPLSSDQDFFGFVLGFQDQGHFYLIDWKKETQNDPFYGLGPVGIRVKKVNTASPVDQRNLWAGNGAVTVLSTLSTQPWNDLEQYDFTFTLRSDGFDVLVTSAASGTIASASINDTTYTSGLFGLYDMSQEFANFTNLILQTVPAQKVISQINHQYYLQTWIGANTQSRYTRPYTNLTRTNTYGNQDLAAAGTISWVITDYDLGQYIIEQRNPLFGLFPAAAPPVVYKTTVFNVTLPPFALYCFCNAIDLNLSANYTVLSLPPQGFLTVQSLTGASGGSLPWLPSQLGNPAHYQLGFGMINQTAQIGQQGEVFELAFYSDDIPSVGARIRFQSWAAGQSVARVRDTIAVANEAAVSGDDGVRSAIMNNISPPPRTSDECEAAAAAAIHDREYPQFQGSYGQQIVPFQDISFFAPSVYEYPKSGEYLYINAPFRGISGQNFFVNQVTIRVDELKQEVMTITVNFGPDLYLEKLLPPFLEREQNILTPVQTAPTPDYITLPEVLNAFLPTLDDAQVTGIVDSLTGNYIVVDLGSAPVTGCEVRSVDSGWGIANQGRVGLFTTQTFTLPRTIRDQTFYLRTLNGDKFSRFSKALRVLYPLVPTPPGLIQASVDKAVFSYTGDVRDVYGLELRVTPISGVTFYNIPDTSTDSLAQLSRTAVSPSTSVFHNVLAVYNPPSQAAVFPYGIQLQVGDIVITQCPNDTSFKGINIVTEAIQSSNAAAPVFPTNVTLNGANALFFQNLQSDNGFEKTFPLTQADSSFRAIFVGLSSLRFNSQLGQSLDPSVQPMTVDAFDSNGLFHGRQVVWTGATQGYDMVVSGSLFFPAAGLYTLNITHDDAMIFGIEGATRVSGLMNDPHFSHTQTAILGLPILGMNNVNGFYPNESYVVSIPASGSYRFEIDYDQWIHAQTLQVQINGEEVFPTPPGIGTGGTTGNPWEYGMFDYGQPVPDNIGSASLTNTNQIGTVQLLQRGAFFTLVSGSIQANYTGVCRCTVSTPHGLVAGQTVIIGAGWGAFTAPIQAPPRTGAVFCGQHIVTNIVSSTAFEFVIDRFTDPSQTVFGTWEQQAAASGVSVQTLKGSVAIMPTPQSFATASGVILQRPVFAPSDLIVDFTQPDLAQTLELIQLLSTSNRVAGVKAYFFNLQWDYSAPTPIPAFEIPTIDNVFIDANTQTINWNVNSGTPKGYRITVKDPVSGIVFNTFTVDNPLNSVPLTQFKMLAQDFVSDRVVTVTPFDALGDGLSSNIPAGGFSSNGGVASPFSYSIGMTWNGYLTTGAIIGRRAFDYPVNFYQNLIPSVAWVDIPTASGTIMVLSVQKFSTLEGTQEVGEEIACIVFTGGSHFGTITAPAAGVTFAATDVIKVIASSHCGTGAGFGITLSGILNPTAGSA